MSDSTAPKATGLTPAKKLGIGTIAIMNIVAVVSLRGLPAEDSKSSLTLDSESRLANLTQDDWQVEYLSYVEQNGYWLPERMKLHGANLDITLVIKDWQPRQLGQ